MIDELLNKAAEEANTGVCNHDGGPFGAVITDCDGNIISLGHNEVLKTNDPTNHAEIVAIRHACQKLNTHDLSNYIIYSSCEPCPMCLSAIIWSNIKTMYFGVTRIDAEKIGFRDNIIYEYLDNKNNILEKHDINNSQCKRVLEDYKGEIY
jgi:guanine deaminase